MPLRNILSYRLGFSRVCGSYIRRPEMSFSCYGDRENPAGTTSTGTHPARAGRSGFTQIQTADMDCRGERGGIEFVNVRERRSPGNNQRRTDPDFEDWDWQWRCMDGTRGLGGDGFASESGQRDDTLKPIVVVGCQDDMFPSTG